MNLVAWVVFIIGAIVVATALAKIIWGLITVPLMFMSFVLGAVGGLLPIVALAFVLWWLIWRCGWKARWWPRRGRYGSNWWNRWK